MKYETVDGSDVDQIMKGGTLARPTMSDLIEKENSKAAVPPVPKAQSGGDAAVSGDLVPQPG